jgi:DNA-binding response OmpR family regulator
MPLSRSEPPALTGCRVLVVEDDYYLASDIQDVLEEAGAEVAGPFPDCGGALQELTGRRPDCALVDVNLGHGPGFEIASLLRERRIPFLFVTGYGAEGIDAAFADVVRIEKPAEPRQVLDAVATLIRKRPDA